MPLPTSGPLSLSDINIEVGRASNATCSMNDEIVRDLIDVGENGNQSIQQYRGQSRDVSFNYELIGGGGAGGFGVSDGGASGRGASGGVTRITGTSITDITADGGEGGRNAVIGYTVTAGRAGEASIYGSGGAGGGNGTAGQDAPASSYGAGGGGGGHDTPSFFDSSGNAGEGGSAGTRVTGTLSVLYGTVLSIQLGAGGVGTGGLRSGGDGGIGYVKITIGNTVHEFTNSGTLTVQ